MNLFKALLSCVNFNKKNAEKKEFEKIYRFKIKKHVLFYKNMKINLPRSINNFDFLKNFVVQNKVTQIMPFGEIFIILLDPDLSRDNIVAIDKTGKILWRIAPVPYEPPAYFGFDITVKGDEIVVVEGRGYFAVDPYTGNIKRMVAGPH